jgi:diguanylate cyclase (GGDEF)-like protein
MRYQELLSHLLQVGRDPSCLIFEDELTRLHNRRFLLSYFEHKVDWAEGGAFPLSLLTMDVDHFKRVNDTYGHEAGDQVLVSVASILRAAVGSNSFPIRYGGDEFMVLLPGVDTSGAVAVAEDILRATREQFLLRANDRANPTISLSIGVASAPADAVTGAELLRRADEALYGSKRRGRNRVMAARDTDPGDVAPRIALHRLEAAAIAGRSGELHAAATGLHDLRLGDSRFLLVEGSAGSGKTTLVETIRRNIDGTEALAVVRLTCERHEVVQPYSLARQALVSLMARDAERSAAALDALTPEELHYLGHVIPMVDSSGGAPDQDDRRRRERIFLALVKFTAELLQGRPLAVLVDDIQFADEATLAFMRVLFRRRLVPIFVCATAGEDEGASGGAGVTPWQRFAGSMAPDLPLLRRQLQPLTAEDVRTHLTAVFPGIELPPGLEIELARITAGSPLFLSQILRKLVFDQKVSLVGGGWAVAPLQPGYLPASLDELVNQRLGSLDEKGRRLLEQVSTMGEHASVSMVAGATKLSENEVLEFLDRARVLGLIGSEFEVNDATMHFVGKRIRDIVYGAIQPPRRQALHEQIGVYQEGLHQQGFGPSVSSLAFHFERSPDRQKAETYRRSLGELQRRTFDREEAERYTGAEPTADDLDVPASDRLDAEALALIPPLFRSFVSVVRNVQLYPPESRTVRQAHEAAHAAVLALLKSVDSLELSRSEGALLANGHKLDTAEFRMLATAYLELLDRAELESMAFRRGLGFEEFRTFLTLLGLLKPEAIDTGYWTARCAEHRLPHIELRQLRYRLVRQRQTAGDPQAATALTAEEWRLLPRVLRALLGAAKSARLYPIGSQQVDAAADLLLEALSAVFARRPLFVLGRAADSLLANGVRVPTGPQSLADPVAALLAAAEIESITFSDPLSKATVLAFLGALQDVPPAVAPSYWTDAARERSFQGLLVNDRRYALSAVELLVDSIAADPDVVTADPEALTNPDDGATSELVEAMPLIVRGLMGRGDDALVRKVLKRLFTGYDSRGLVERARTVRACRLLTESLPLAMQHQFGALAVDNLADALRAEADGDILRDLAGLLQQLSRSALHFADLQLAARMFGAVRDRQQALMRSTLPGDRGVMLLNRNLDAQTTALLTAEIQSKEPTRQESAALLLENIGPAAVPILIDVIKEEPDFRTRQLAATLLSRIGGDAADRFRQQLVLEVDPEQRLRIMEVIDVVTHDLASELALCLGDENPKVHLAAFRLAERLAAPPVILLLAELTGHSSVGIARAAISALGNLRSPNALAALIATLETAREPETVTACAQALAQFGDRAAIPALEAILAARKFPMGPPRWSEHVRATASFALDRLTPARSETVKSPALPA